MSPLLIAAIVVITLALIFYSIGVLGEAKRKFLYWRDVAWFALGLTCDTTGTLLMKYIAETGAHDLAPWASSLMAVTGTAAILLMVVHIFAATFVLIKHPEWREKFHVISLVIYTFWLIAYALGPIGLMG